ncbi:MAG: nucleotidyltransferase domain-containing protein [Ferruginibacter sp.]|nr:nucleotidyltransferase domain-containing protein [Ferruginibacter sp.]
MITAEQINLLKDVIVQTMQPEKVYLFGSYAHGVPNEDSDLDILIEVEKTDLRSSHRSLEVSTNFNKYKELHFSKDIFVYTTPEVEKFSNNKYSFLSSILKNSKLIYES